MFLNKNITYYSQHDLRANFLLPLSSILCKNGLLRDKTPQLFLMYFYIPLFKA